MPNYRNPHHVPTVLVANRGEIAVRVFRTARRMGLRCAAVYSEADAGAPFVRLADAAYCIGPAPAAQSYLRAEKILEAAKALRADLIHPGFGFLSEDPTFGRAVEAAGYVFVGPPPAVLAAMGGKDEAKRIAEAAGVPVLPGYGGADQDDAALERAAKEIGYPLIVKPAAGGGGKGMAVVRTEDDLLPALASARRVAAGAFGDTKLLLERYLPAPRHIEVQVMADGFGNVIHLGERDCSLQRRHQKILEESPSPAVDPALREQLTSAAVKLCRHVGYRNAGTCEFLVEDGFSGGASGGGAPRVFGFIEMNARLQVEHPVTEMVTGLDLVELQLRVAMGEPLPLTQADVTPTGHAIEVRLYAEDPDAGFLPQSGRLLHLRWPAEARIDSGVDEGAEVTTHYDPMLAKVIVHADDRPAALACLAEALAETEVLGLRTNLPFLRMLAADPTVAAGNVTTTWLESAYAGWTSGVDDRPIPEPAIALAGAAEAARLLADAAPPSGPAGPEATAPGAARAARTTDRSALDPWSTAGPWRHLEPGPTHVIVQAPTVGGSPVAAGERLVDVRGRGPFRVGETVLVPADAVHEPDGTGCLQSGHGWSVNGTRAAAVAAPGMVHVFWGGHPYEFPLGIRPRLVDAEGGPAQLGAPMPGTVIAIKVAAGDAVERGQTLVVVEAMKMELEVKASAAGTVSAVLCAAGEAVKKGQPLVALEAAPE